MNLSPNEPINCRIYASQKWFPTNKGKKIRLSSREEIIGIVNQPISGTIKWMNKTLLLGARVLKNL